MPNTNLERVRLTGGGYDRSGTYWGAGRPLYYFQLDDTDMLESGYIRAYDRADAKAKVAERFPNARFYR